MIKPRTPAPALDLPLVAGGRWCLADQHPEAFSLVVFYRGLHSPVCRGYLKQLDRMLEEFADAGVTSVVAVSGDDGDRAEQTVQSWRLERLPVAYGQTIASMRDWGLFISKGVKDGEPDEFGEPGLYAGVINTMPFARPHFDEVLAAVRYVREHDYPARGEA